MYSDFGSILRNARMRQGYDINTVAHRLRIRPDVIHSIEMADFDRMPPRGYARNMISSYARLLGLDPSDMTRRYLDELHDYQVGRVGGGSRQGSYDQRNRRNGERAGRSSADDRRLGEREARRLSGRSEGPNRAGGRRQSGGYDWNDRDSRDGRLRDGAPRGGNGARHEAGGRNRSDHSRQGQGAVIGGSLNRGAAGASSFVGDLRNRLPFMGVAIAVIVLVIILLVLLFGPKGNDSEEVANMPVTGVESATVSTAVLDDSSSSESDSPGSSSSESEPKAFTFSYEVADGASVYIDCTVDGQNRVSQQVTGPTKQEFTVSNNVTFTAGSDEGVTVRVDDDEVKLKTDSSTGYATYTQKFSSYLKNWRKAHNVDASGSDSSSSSSSTADDDTSSSTDGSSATGASASTSIVAESSSATE